LRVLCDFRNVIGLHGQEDDLLVEGLVAPKMVAEHLGRVY
jgi:hypothetical protein